MSINIALLEKLAKEERKAQKPESKLQTAAALFGVNLVPSTATGALYSALTSGGKKEPNVSSADLSRRANRVFKRVARKAGLKYSPYREKSEFDIGIERFNQGYNDARRRFDPSYRPVNPIRTSSPRGKLHHRYVDSKGKPVLEFLHDAPGMPNGAFTSPDGTKIYAKGRAWRTPSTLAHELGHVQQGKGLLRANIVGKNVGGLASLGILANSLLTNDHKKRDERNKNLAIAGSLGFGTTLATEIDASRRGAKLLTGTRNKLKAFMGIPSYALVGATPYLMYRANKYLNPPKGSNDK